MTENTNAGNGNNNNGGQGGGANPPADANANANANANGGQNNQNTPTPPSFDPAKVSDAEFAKIFDDPRVFQHSRFKELAEDAKAGKAAKEAEAKRQQDEAIKKGEFDKVLSERDKKIAELQTSLTTGKINQSLTLAATKLGAVDLEAVLALVDRSKLSIDEATGTVKGIDEALKTLSETKTYLFGKQSTQRLGSQSNPNNQNTGELKRFKHSEIQNPEFYRANEKDILASMAAGLIENDL